MPAPRTPARSISRLLLAAIFCALPLRASETIRQVQEELRKRDLYFGDVDGRDTPQVSAAVRTYQQRKGFTVTGQLDDTTLRSLQLLPALSAPEAVAASTAPATVPVAYLWPDITVLRSDEARRNPIPSAAGSPTAVAVLTPTPGPPPAAVSRRRPNADEVRDFLARYLQAGQTNDPPTELNFYGDHVDYFNEGVVDRHFIAGDVNRYDHRWPARQFTLLGPVTLSDAPDHDPDKVVAHFRYAFLNKGARYTVEGKADNVFTLQYDDPRNPHIIGMKEQRVRGK